MNIIYYLRKANIEAKYCDKDKTFTFNVKGEEVIMTKKEIEQYLFICLMDLINDTIK